MTIFLPRTGQALDHLETGIQHTSANSIDGSILVPPLLKNVARRSEGPERRKPNMEFSTSMNAQPCTPSFSGLVVLVADKRSAACSTVMTRCRVRYSTSSSGPHERVFADGKFYRPAPGISPRSGWAFSGCMESLGDFPACPPGSLPVPRASECSCRCRRRACRRGHTRVI